ncbi:2-O-methyltransferase NoeI [mine drainage metagenome]|uniref:protein O-GlcNAc transferase n=1 Tax=mine drainage metagenome TaxID=410659 RepID=A0A1J5ST31_9ZZZZ
MTRLRLKDRLTARLLDWVAKGLAKRGHAALAGQLAHAADAGPSYLHARALWTEDHHDAAAAELAALLANEPDHARAHNLLGAICLEREDHETAAEHFIRARALRPDLPEPHNNLGNVHLARHELQRAAACYRAALACDRDYVEALTNLGSVLNSQGEHGAAERVCRRAVQLAPQFAGAHCNLGNVLLSLGRVGEAVAAYREALRLSPGLVEALINLALALEEPAYLVGTIDYYEKKLALQPDSYLPQVRIAQALQVMDRWDEARERLERALEINPDAAEARFLLGNNHVHAGDTERGMREYRRLLIRQASPAVHSSLIFSLLYRDGVSGETLCAEYRRWAGQLESRRRKTPLRAPPASDRPLRIGYVSRDFARHSVAFFLQPILANHDRSRFVIHCYSTLIRGDAYTERFRLLADRWRDISLASTDEILKQIAEDEIDILVDLSGHTSGNRLAVFAAKPAPIQLTYLGHPATTGLTAIDYRIGDATTDPPGVSEAHYSEKLWRLPGCFLAYRPPDDAPEVAPPPSAARGYVTFGSFNNAAKVNGSVIAAWAEILAAVPNSRLLLKSYAFATRPGRERIETAFAARGVTPDRLELVAWRPESKHHLELYGEIDIALDPFPYNGTTTTCEALWMGVPVVCLAGERHSGRVGASLLAALDLSELLAEDIRSYVRIAVELAGEGETLRALRRDLRQRLSASSLLDHAGFTRKLESAFRAMCTAKVCGTDKTVSTTDTAAAIVELSCGNGVRICLPDSLEVISRYVLEEQGDWFEDEIALVRKLLAPGQTALDIGANVGVYALSMAELLGPAGAVWAYEPAPAVAALLRRSAAANDYGGLTVIERAVCAAVGSARFELAENAELSRILAAGGELETGIEVETTTLDACLAEWGWRSLDFVKIDAEGQEANVVRGGRRLFTELSPLVMAEYRHGSEFNETLPDEFARLGYRPYRLVPGLMLLAPLDGGEARDPFLLNLFFCRDDRARNLAARGLLVVDQDGSEPAPRDYQETLDSHARAQDATLSASRRLGLLSGALSTMESLVCAAPTLARRLSLARLRADYGLREGARREFERIANELRVEDAVVADDDRFLLPLDYFARIECSGERKTWLLAAVSTWLATRSSHSTYFTPDLSLHHLHAVRKTGYRLEETETLIDLILRRRYGNSCIVEGWREL